MDIIKMGIAAIIIETLFINRFVFYPLLRFAFFSYPATSLEIHADIAHFFSI